MQSLLTLVPVALFLALCLGVAIWARGRAKGGFASEYFIGGRSMGPFVLAMTTIATYGSVSSFVGGPGQAWEFGFGWVYMASVQVTALFLLFGILGKKMALIGRKVDAITVIDVIRARYGSNALATLSACVIVLFFAAMMVAQFVGGAKLFEAVTGYPYLAGLAIFGGATVIYTSIGGFRGVALTDALCGVAMLLGIVVLACGIFIAGGGFPNVVDTIANTKPELLRVDAGGNMPWGLYLTQWLLVGVLTFALPQSALRNLGFKDTKSLRRAMVMGTVIIGAMMIGMTSLGVFAAGVLPGELADYGGSVDNIIPAAIATTLPPWLAGVCIIGPVAASISTVSSLLITASSSIVKDLYLHAAERRGEVVPERRVAGISQAITLIAGVLVFACAVTPPDVIWKINMFAFGGLETAFCWVLVCGLFWKRANSYGAIASMAGGTLAYCACMSAGLKFMGLHQIVIGITVSLALMVAVSLFTQGRRAPGGTEQRQKMEAVFFPE